jgi:feruloyl-CoA synthase
VLAGRDVESADIECVLSHPSVRQAIATALTAYNRSAGGSSNRIARVILLAEPPSVDGNEITDKGYLNQRAVLERRASMVERLYAATPDPAVIVVPD